MEVSLILDPSALSRRAFLVVRERENESVMSAEFGPEKRTVTTTMHSVPVPVRARWRLHTVNAGF